MTGIRFQVLFRRFNAELPRYPNEEIIPLMLFVGLNRLFYDPQARMRMTSGTLQRWMSSWISFTIIWLAKFVLIWLDHTTTYIELAQFALPLLLLLILCSAYGEANSECSRIIQVGIPTNPNLMYTT